MSDTKKITTYVVANDSVVSIEISGAYYKRITALYFNLVKKIGTEHFEKIVKALIENKLENLAEEQDKHDGLSIDTLLILMTAIESKFKEDNLINKQELEIPNVD